MQLSQINKRLAEGNLQLNDLDNGNRKAMAENGDLLRQLEEVDGRKLAAMFWLSEIECPFQSLRKHLHVEQDEDPTDEPAGRRQAAL